MITINLLPNAYRTSKASSLHQLPRSPLAFLVGGVAVGLWVLLIAVMGLSQMRLATLTAQIHQLGPQKATADQLHASVQALRDQHAVYQHVSQDRSQWASRLTALSDVTPDGVWLTELSLNPQQGLEIEGSAIGQGGEEMVRIKRFVQELKTHPALSALVRDVQIESIKSVMDGEIEVIKFTTTCALATAPAAKRRTKR